MRKVLSFVLVLTLVLSSFSMAFAADATASAGLSDVAGSANAQAIEVANNLGIVTGNPDGTFQPEKAVNRAEFAAMITRALGIPESALAGYTTTSFKDTTGYGWAVPYLAFCQSKGIMLGDGAGNAMPGRTINTNEAATMILRALGYTSNSSALIGVWPANYVSMAQDLGIYDDTAAATNVDKQNAAQMIYNALSVQKVQVAADGTTTRLVNANNVAVTMLTSGLGCEDEGYGVVSYDADAVINTVPYLGLYAKTYTNKSGDLIAVDSIQGTALTGTFVDNAPLGVLDVSDEFEVDDVTYTIDATNYLDKNTDTRTAANTFGQFVNGENTAITFADGATYTFNVGLSNKSVQNLYSVEEWTVSAAAKVVAGDLVSIEDGALLGYDFATDKSDNIIAKSYELVGVNSLSDIKADNIVYVYEDDGRDEISKVTVGTEVVEGKVTKVNPADSEWTVGGKVYAFGLNGANGSKAYANELNNEVKLYLDQAGDIYKYDVTSGSAKDYAVLLNWDTAGTLDGNMRLYLADDSKKTFSSDFDEWAWFSGGGAASLANNGNRLIGYGVDKDGVIDGVYPKTAADASAWVTGASTFKSNTVVTIGGTDRVISSSVVVFTEDAAGAITGVAKIADVDKNTAGTIAGVEALVRDNKIVALIVDEAFVSGSGDSQYAVVSAADSAVNPAGDKAQVLTGFIDGKKMDADTVYTSGQSTVANFEVVNLFKIKYNDDKNISKADGQSAVVTDTAITKNGYVSDGFIKTGANGATVNAVADNAVFYEVVFETAGDETSGIDKYKAFNGTIYAGMDVWMYDTDTDEAGAEVVIIDKNGVSSYSEPSFTVTADAATLATTAGITTMASVTAYSYTNDDAAVIDDFAVTAVTAGFGLATTDFSVALDGSTVKIVKNATTATTVGAFTVTVTLTDANSNTVSKDFSVTVY